MYRKRKKKVPLFMKIISSVKKKKSTRLYWKIKDFTRVFWGRNPKNLIYGKSTLFHRFFLYNILYFSFVDIWITRFISSVPESWWFFFLIRNISELIMCPNFVIGSWRLYTRLSAYHKPIERWNYWLLVNTDVQTFL